MPALFLRQALDFLADHRLREGWDDLPDHAFDHLTREGEHAFDLRGGEPEAAQLLSEVGVTARYRAGQWRGGRGDGTGRVSRGLGAEHGGRRNAGRKRRRASLDARRGGSTGSDRRGGRDGNGRGRCRAVRERGRCGGARGCGCRSWRSRRGGLARNGSEGGGRRGLAGELLHQRVHLVDELLRIERLVGEVVRADLTAERAIIRLLLVGEDDDAEPRLPAFSPSAELVAAESGVDKATLGRSPSLPSARLRSRRAAAEIISEKGFRSPSASSCCRRRRAGRGQALSKGFADRTRSSGPPPKLSRISPKALGRIVVWGAGPWVGRLTEFSKRGQNEEWPPSPSVPVRCCTLW